jgi:hypothetical protein
MHGEPCWRLLTMTALPFASMYVFKYAMVNFLANVILNLNRFQMAGRRPDNGADGDHQTPVLSS